VAIRPRKRQRNSNVENPNSAFSIDSPEQLRHLTLDKVGFGEDILCAIARVFSIRVEYIPLELEASGTLSYDQNIDQWLITINSLHHPKRQRFTFAHELAHFFLHRNQQFDFSDTVFFRADNVKSRIEFEANNFAGALLMPKDEFIDYVKNTSNNIEDISNKFNTSAMAVKVRADVLRGQKYEY
jgi:Zn-dependent peptidase ImmA (M78 family)